MTSSPRSPSRGRRVLAGTERRGSAVLGLGTHRVAYEEIRRPGAGGAGAGARHGGKYGEACESDAYD